MINKLNTISAIIYILVLLFSFVEYDKVMDVNIPYLAEVFVGLLVFLGLMFLIKVAIKWQGLFLGLKAEGYKIEPIGFTKILALESFFLIYFGGIGFYLVCSYPEVFWLGLLALIFLAESVIYLVVQYVKKPFKIILNHQNITVITHDLNFIRWSDVQQIDSRHNDIHFKDKLGRIKLIDLELINPLRKSEFISKVENIAQEKEIYCSIDCKRGYYQSDEEI